MNKRSVFQIQVTSVLPAEITGIQVDFCMTRIAPDEKQSFEWSVTIPYHGNFTKGQYALEAASSLGLDLMRFVEIAALKSDDIAIPYDVEERIFTDQPAPQPE